jgi:hypothetical protein
MFRIRAWVWGLSTLNPGISVNTLTAPKFTATMRSAGHDSRKHARVRGRFASQATVPICAATFWVVSWKSSLLCGDLIQSCAATPVAAIVLAIHAWVGWHFASRSGVVEFTDARKDSIWVSFCRYRTNTSPTVGSRTRIWWSVYTCRNLPDLGNCRNQSSQQHDY